MKFARFYLKAYGPFRDRVIDLPTVAGKDLHIVFGPNEAGKSTILRAVTGFLFGIPERTNDAFLHDYNALRVGATLLLPDGNRLSAMRRKARKATLFAIDERTGNEITDRPLEDQTISAILGGLDQTLYQNLFGLDLTGLVAGSEELLRGEGEVGRSLFQAAAGLSSLRSLISGLDEEATALFKPRGSTSRINRAFTEFDQQKRVLKDSTVRSYAWESVEREYRQAEAKHAQVRDTLRSKRAEQQRLERIRANLPLVAERVTKQVELDQLKQVPVLPADAAQRRIASQERLRGANEAAVAADAQVTQVNIELADVVVRETLLDHATPIEQAFHGAGDYRTAREAIPRVNSQQATAIAQIRGLLDEIDPSCDLGQAPAILPKQTLAARVQSLVEDQSRLTGLDEQLDAQARTKRAALERLGSRLAKLPQPVSLGDLELSLRSVANVPDLEARRHKLDGEIADLDGRLQNDAAALWNGSLPEILALTVPLPETAASFEADFSKLAQDQRLNAEKSADLARDIEERHRELKALAATGEVVTRVEVVSARNHRDEGWARVRRAYVERTAELDQAAKDYAAQGSLADALENAIKEADRLADLLHADAQRAAKLETTRQRIVDMQETLNRIEEQRKLLAGNGQELHIRWAALIDTTEEIVAKLGELKASIEKGDLKPWEFRGMKAIWFGQHLYQPLLYLDANIVEISPAPLNKGERQFVEDLKAFHDGNADYFKTKELYLLRNLSKGRGVGFFEAGNFHPDFILWLLADGKQQVIFVDPKGIRNIGWDDDKIQFHEKVKEIEQRLGDADVRLHSFIVSNTSSATMRMLWRKEKDEMLKRNVLFQEEDKETYVRSMLDMARAGGATR